MILVSSSPDDLHTQRVMEALSKMGARTLLFDTSRFPERSALTFRTARPRLAAVLHNPELGEVDLRAARAVWWRRPQPITISAAVRDPEHRRFTFNEAAESLAGLWEVLDVFWMNRPDRDLAAHRKVLQLQLASQVGLRCPRTVITSNPDEARAFIEANAPAPTIYKAFSATAARWRETRVVRSEEIALLGSVRHCPVIFQEYIPAECDLRVTAVHGELFVGQVRAPEDGYPYDYRIELDRCPISSGTLLPDTETKLRALLDRLGLVYGAIDLRRTPEGEEIFLEVNPAGQWLFVEERTCLPITAAIAGTLANGAAPS